MQEGYQHAETEGMMSSGHQLHWSWPPGMAEGSTAGEDPELGVAEKALGAHGPTSGAMSMQRPQEMGGAPPQTSAMPAFPNLGQEMLPPRPRLPPAPTSHPISPTVT